MAKKSARATRPKGDVSNPPATAASDAKRDRPANPLATDPEIHPAIRPLFDAVVMVGVWGVQVAGCYREMIAMRDARGLPKPDEWPDSPTLKLGPVGVVEPQWTELLRKWTGVYREWCEALATARKLAGSPAVVAIMDGGESRPAERWTARVVIDLDKLAGMLHPVRLGGVDGLGFIRCGLPPLPPEFADRAVAVADRIGELRAVPASLGEPHDAPAVATAGTPQRSLQGPKTRRGFLRMAEVTAKDLPIVEALKRNESYRAIARDSRVSKSTVGRIAKAYDLTGHHREPVPLDGTLQENLSIRGKPGKHRKK